MNNAVATNWQSFKNELLLHTDKHLQFKYAEDKLVDPSYHITEIKQAPIISVDCGGKLNTWTEVIVQLWEPASKSAENPMKVSKALSIIRVVEEAMSINPMATVKIEFGNPGFDTRQMYPNNLSVDGNSLIVDLIPDKTQCKAIERGGSCGTASAENEACCAPAKTALKPKVEMKNLAAASACCEPGGGCC
ncbi:hypothetical protein BEL04_02925 [Mucilaginibacter sp. PPCGB 2223]|uniref:DUF6428 family protein n=1 Tax=Mucilaginibacter sp. PPCGB 2223 TaxID=1886027 RepID=UPI0008262D34|nr:DUF6428 family protein [Mucilaginibacter sp. PPCGB 2223]OCX53275.1 hypothetical protein BEL04_02925 [Mucilaginibacter sp. PPCGB 2223]